MASVSATSPPPEEESFNVSVNALSDADYLETCSMQSGASSASRSSSPNRRTPTKKTNMAKLLPRSKQPNLQQVLRQTLRAMAVNALWAALARLALGVSKALLKGGFSRRFIKYLGRETFSMNHFKWAAVLAGLSSFRLLQQLLLRIPHMNTQLSSLLGGAAASLPLMVMNVSTRTELGLYLGVRAAHGFLTAYWNALVPIPALRDFAHYDTVAMVLAAWQILYAHVFEPHTHSQAYNEFLYQQTKLHPSSMNVVAGLVRRQVVPEMLSLNKLLGINAVTPEHAKLAAAGVPGFVVPAGARVVDPNDLKQVCLYMHPGLKSCDLGILRFMWRHMTTVSLPLYLPLKVITTLVFSWKRVMKDPAGTATKALKSVAMSASFLTLYVATPIRTTCLCSGFGLHSPVGMATAASLAGLATLLEPKGRRLDLALYCSMHALRSFVNLMHTRGLIPRPTRRWVFALHLAAVASIFFQYDTTAEALHPNLRKALCFLLGEKYREPEEIQKALAYEASRGKTASLAIAAAAGIDVPAALAAAKAARAAKAAEKSAASPARPLEGDSPIDELIAIRSSPKLRGA